MPRPTYNRSADERYFNVAGAEPEVRCSVDTCPERTWEPWMWTACDHCGQHTCPDHLVMVDGVAVCTPCVALDAERAVAA